MTLKQIPTEAIVLSVEAVLSRQHELSESTKDNIRSRVTSTLQSASLPNSNLTPEEQKALKLKTDENIVILPPERYGWLLLWTRPPTTTKWTPLLTTNWPKRYLNETRQPHCNANLTTNCFNTLKKTDKIYFRCYNRLSCSVPQPPNIRMGYRNYTNPTYLCGS